MAEQLAYKTLREENSAEFIINKSRFIGYGCPCQTEEEALSFLSRIRTKHKDATHNCYAYIIGLNSGIMRYSDDGEPGGTAGMPIIEVMKARGVVNCAVVVTRYFGGIKLGGGGLIRAYGKATTEGLKAVKVLASEGSKTNVTLIFTANQALLAARAGATYVSPFLGRLDDISTNGVELISTIAEMFAVADIPTEIIAASVRHPMHVTDCALAGADIATVPYSVLEQMTKHPLTDAGIEKFQKDYIAVFGE